MGQDDDLWEGLAALLLGFIGIALIASIINPKCPNCKHNIQKGAIRCPNCGVILRWS
jgi:tRNA(Ile2) C34 agmatinyltransferase TiaS